MKRRVVLAAAVLLALAGGLRIARGEAGERESALDAHLRDQPGALADGSLAPLEARLLDALTPEQAEGWAAGEDPRSIFLESGESLADFMESLLAGGQGLVYVPLDRCQVLRTVTSVAGALTPGTPRDFFVRGATTDLSAQGGSATGCGVPADAVALAIHLRLRPQSPGVATELRAGRTGGPPMPHQTVEFLRQSMGGGRMGVSIVGLCESGCAAGDFLLEVLGSSAHVRGDGIGFFRPIEAADLVGLSGGDADTLDGLDSLDFALASHTHDGGDITSGTVGEPFLDSLLARDGEVFSTLLDNDGSGSLLDSDLLDGRHASEFRPRPQNVILVDAAGGGDFTTISAALASISGESASNRFLVRVGVGVYAEQVAMKPFVDIEGKGEKATTITSGAPGQTLLGASDAELRHLSVVNEHAFFAAVAIGNDGSAPGGGDTMLRHVTATARGAFGERVGVLNTNGAAPTLDHVTAVAVPSAGVQTIAVINQNGAVPIIRNSRLEGGSAIENRDAAEANVVYTALAGGADFIAPATQASYHCVRAYVAATLQQLGAECSPNTPPTAMDDVYSTLGNTLLEVTLDHAGAASLVNTTASQPSVIGETTTPKTFRSVFENDSDAETADKNLLAAAVVGGTVTAGAVVDMFADGTFEYTPPVGFSGADTFDYTVTDPGGLMDTGTVTVNVSSFIIWYVDADNGGTADGRSTTPFTSLAPLDGAGGAGDPDVPGQTIFVFDEAMGSTADGIELEDNQILHGNGVALAPADFEYAGGGDLVAAGTAPTLTSSGDVIDLADGNTIRGLDISVGAALAGITGTSPAGLTVDDVGITAADPTALGIRLATPSGSFDIDSLTGVGGASGVEINGGSATFDFDAASSITGSDPAILINGGSTGMTFNGDVSYSSGSNPAIAVEGGHTGTLTFQTGAISATAGTGIGFDNADGTYSFSGTTTLNGGDAGIDILSGSNGTFTFGAGTTITDPTGHGFNLDTSTSGNVTYDGTISKTNVASPASAVRINAKSGGSVSFTGSITGNTATANAVALTSNGGSIITFSGLLDLDTTTGTGFFATGGATATVQATNAGNTVTTTGDGTVGGGTGVSISAGIGGLGVTFSSVDVGSSGKANSGILLTNTGTGTFTVAGGTIQNTTTDGFEAANVDGTVSIGADIQNDGGRSVEITGSEGQFTFDGLIDEDAQGINISSNNTGGPTFTFRGGIDVDAIGSNHGFNAFSGGTLNVCADTNCSAAGGTPVSNTINSNTGSALIVNLVTIGVDGLTFESIGTTAASGSAGIVLTSTGTAGGLTVTGDGALARNASGGTIANKTGDCVTLTNTTDVSLNRMDILDCDGNGINGTAGVNGFVLRWSNVNGHGDGGSAESPIRFRGLTGTADVTGELEGGDHPTVIANSVIKDGDEDNIQIKNETGTLARFVVRDSTVGSTTFGAGCSVGTPGPCRNSNDGINFEGLSSGSANAAMNLRVEDSIFIGNGGDHVNPFHNGSSGSMDVDIIDNDMSDTQSNPLGVGGGVTIAANDASVGTGNTITYNVDDNDITDVVLVGIDTNLVISSATMTMTGTINNNRIGTLGSAGSGSSTGIPIRARSNRAGTHTVAITGNTLRNWCNGGGITLQQRDGGGTLNATVTGNTEVIDAAAGCAGGFAFGSGMLVESGATAGDNGTLCLVIGGAGGLSNTLVDPNGFDPSILVLQEFATTMRFAGYAGAATNPTAHTNLNTFLGGQNTLGTNGVAADPTQPPTFQGNINSGVSGGAPATCP